MGLGERRRMRQCRCALRAEPIPTGAPRGSARLTKLMIATAGGEVEDRMSAPASGQRPQPSRPIAAALGSAGGQTPVLPPKGNLCSGMDP
jgi:hypothetical protein